MAKPYRIAIAGLGTVGGGVVKMLQTHGDLIAQRCGRKVEIAAVSARCREKGRGVDLSGYRWVDDVAEIASLPGVDCVVELIGGTEGPARALVEAALTEKKAVVTANKALLASHGLTLAALSEKKQAPLMYEAAVAGGIPVIKALREGFAGNRINSVVGILNGTCNYILTTMRETGQSFSEVLKEAQERGYAETDPSFDVGGIDAAHKLSLLSSLAFGVAPAFDQLVPVGISRVSALDIRFAQELGFKIKLLGLARRYQDGFVQLVEPCLVPHDRPMASVEGVFNAVMVEGDFCDTGLLVGRGAGEGPTASAVMADIMDLARGWHNSVFGVPAKDLNAAQWYDPGEMASQFYLRLTVLDRPGVLADITAIMRDNDVSMEAVLQRGRDPEKPVSVVITTHKARGSDVKMAGSAIAGLAASVEEPCTLRIERF